MIFGKIKILIRELKGSAFTTFIAILVIITSGTLTLSFHSISGGIRNYVKTKFAGSVPPDTIRVSAPTQRGTSILSLFSSRSSGMSPGKIKRLRKIKYVRRVDALLSVNIPAQAGVRFLNYNYSTDLILAGAPLSMIKKSLKGKFSKWRKFDPENRDIPMILPSALLNTYNNGLAGANGLPPVSFSMISKISLNLSLGYSSVSRLNGAFENTGRVIAVADNINIMGLLIPIDTARRLNRMFDRADSYIYADIIPRNHRSIRYIKRRIRAMGLIANTESSLSGKINGLIGKINLFTTVLLAIIIILASISVAMCCITSLWNRIEYYRTLRILGASRILISSTVVFKFALMGFCATAISLALADKLNSFISAEAGLTGVKIILTRNEYLIKMFLIVGTLIPAISAIPGIIKIFYLEMNRN